MDSGTSMIYVPEPWRATIFTIDSAAAASGGPTLLTNPNPYPYQNGRGAVLQIPAGDPDHPVNPRFFVVDATHNNPSDCIFSAAGDFSCTVGGQSEFFICGNDPPFLFGSMAGAEAGGEVANCALATFTTEEQCTSVWA